MLEYLYYQIGGYFEGSRILTVCNQKGCLVLDHYLLLRRSTGDTRPHFRDVWSEERSTRWLKRLEELHCEEWQDHYDADILDGTQWELRYKYDGKSERCISGSNAYPENWASFQRIMEDAARKLPRAEDIELCKLSKLLVSPDEAQRGNDLREKGNIR